MNSSDSLFVVDEPSFGVDDLSTTMFSNTDTETEIVFSDGVDEEVSSSVIPYSYYLVKLDDEHVDGFNAAVSMLSEAQTLVENGLLPVFEDAQFRNQNYGTGAVSTSPFDVIRSLVFSKAEESINSCYVYVPGYPGNRMPSVASPVYNVESAYAYYRGAVLLHRGMQGERQDVNFADLVRTWMNLSQYMMQRSSEMKKYLVSVKSQTRDFKKDLDEQHAQFEVFSEYVFVSYKAFLVALDLTTRVCQCDGKKLLKGKTLETCAESFGVSTNFVSKIWDYLIASGVFTFSGAGSIVHINPVDSGVYRLEKLFTVISKKVEPINVAPGYFDVLEKMAHMVVMLMAWETDVV